MTPAEINRYIHASIASDMDRARQRWTTALRYLGVAALIIFGTGTVSLIPHPSALSPQPSSKVELDLATCPPLDERSLPIVTFTITMRGDGTPEVQGCNRVQKRFTQRPKQT